MISEIQKATDTFVSLRKGDKGEPVNIHKWVYY